MYIYIGMRHICGPGEVPHELAEDGRGSAYRRLGGEGLVRAGLGWVRVGGHDQI